MENMKENVLVIETRCTFETRFEIPDDMSFEEAVKILAASKEKPYLDGERTNVEYIDDDASICPEMCYPVLWEDEK